MNTNESFKPEFITVTFVRSLLGRTLPKYLLFLKPVPELKMFRIQVSRHMSLKHKGSMSVTTIITVPHSFNRLLHRCAAQIQNHTQVI